MPTKEELNSEVERLRAQIHEMEQTAAWSSASVGGGAPAPQASTGDITALISVMQQTLTSVLQSQPARPEPRVPARKMEAPELKNPAEATLAEFREWQKRFEDYAKGTRLYVDYDLETQREVLRGALHTDWGKLWSGMALGIQDADGPNQIIGKLYDFLRRSRNPLLDRVDFHERDQQVGESLNMYIAALRMILESCGYEDPGECQNCITFTEGLLRDRFVFGLSNKETQRKLLEVPFGELTLERALNVALAHESSMKTQESLQQDPGASANALKRSSYKKAQQKTRLQTSNHSKTWGGPQSGASKGKTGPQHKQERRDPCSFCGGTDGHPRNGCPAKGRKCNKCQKVGHYAKCCRDGSGKDSNPGPKVGHLFLGKVTNTCGLEKIATATEVNGVSKSMNWLPDTGASCTAMPQSCLDKFPGSVVQKGKNKNFVTTANGSRVQTVGVIQATIVREGKCFTTTVHVLRSMTDPLLSKQGCIELGLLPQGWPNVVGKLSTSPPLEPGNKTLEMEFGGSKELLDKFRSEFPNVFDDSGVLPPMGGPKMHIELEPDAVPVRRLKPRTIPIHWEPRVKQQLETMVATDIVERVPVGNSPAWVHPMMAVPKKASDEPRMVVDLTALNRYVKRPVHPGGVPRDLVGQIPAGMKYFASFDARHGYWQVELDEESRELTTFMTPWGMYRYKRNVMGLASAGDEFTRRIDDALKGIPNVIRVVEDILIFDEDYESHLPHIRQISAEGYTVDEDLCALIAKFPTPTDRTDVRSFCGLVNQFEQFSSEIATIATPLRSLLSPSSKFVWEQIHEDAFQRLKAVLTGPRVLALFIPGSPMRLETDAFRTGLGFALWQLGRDDNIWKLLRCGSRFVSDRETRYSVTELELQAVVWGARKADQFIRGVVVELIVDHKPLIPIINSKSLDQIGSSRLVLQKEKLSDYRLNASWRQGSQHTVADVFSRYPVSAAESEGAEEEDQKLRLAALSSKDVAGVDLLHDLAFVELQRAGTMDPIYQQLCQQITNGFPAQRHQLATALYPYWTIKNDLSVHQGLAFYGDRVIVPTNRRSQMLSDLHASHQGQERTMRRARLCVYWPGISEDIRAEVRSCSRCAELLPSNQQEPLLSDKLCSYSGEAIAADIFAHAGREFLVVTDKFSGWPEVWCLGSSADTAVVILSLETWISGHGSPIRLTTDGGPQFKSREFDAWCNGWAIKHDFSSPYHHIANGHAEAAVKAMKHLAIKCRWNGNKVPSTFTAGLLEWRNTPRSDGLSPAQRIFGHPLRSKLPMVPPSERVEPSEADKKAAENKARSASRYNDRSKILPVFGEGERVYVQNPTTKRWDLTGEIVRRESRGRSYLVKAETGRIYWRNGRFLRPNRAASSDDEFVEQDDGSTEPRRSTRARKPVDRYSS